MPDPMNTDINRMVAALVRAELRNDDEDLERFRAGGWQVRLSADSYVVRWPDGTLIASFDVDKVALAVGLLRAKRDATIARTN